MVMQRDAASYWNTTPMGSLFPRARAVVGYQLTEWFAVDAGASVRILVPTLSSSLSGDDPGRAVLQPAFILGVHLG